ncbi:hypothetical protein KCV87_00700 [Actinosynnema pretiosum subsp. pretiosum]|uniref:Uncharacterized protein n=1 Tax=Actinosynnema pretiosum subsp. pretiosum TaxID=103721 RepID=A0AA45R4J8_9PSEU|nr:hypothetical protein APASM_3866 [Actinosynnema pretiosum subsp. pretiosum]QUF04698.1 hypothetical protein KCV87_00700 [Actinosynnema pretiosum subsp. pretiosum]
MGDLLEACAERWRPAYEIVVIRDAAAGRPSRGIVVAHLPDALVVDRRGIDAGALASASEARHLLPYGRAELLVLPLHGPVEDVDRWTLTWVRACVRPEQVAELVQDDVRLLAALLVNGFAGTDLLFTDPEGYVFAAEHRDGFLEAARAVRPELPHLAPGSDLDRVLRDLLRAEPTPMGLLRDALVSDAEIESQVSRLLDAPDHRPLDAQPTRAAALPARHACPVDGNYVWYRHGDEPVPRCADHPVVLEPAPITRRVDPFQLWSAVAERVRAWTATGDPGARSSAELEREALDLLAAVSSANAIEQAVTAALSELQRAELLSGDAGREARERALSLFSLLHDEKNLPESLRQDVDALLESDREAVLRAAGGLWRAAGERDAPGLAVWASALVTGPGLNAELLQNRVNTLIELDAETGDHAHLSEALFVGRTAVAALGGEHDTAGSSLVATTAFGMIRWQALTGDRAILDEAIALLRAEVANAQAWSAVPTVLVSALTQRAAATGALPDVAEALSTGDSALVHPGPHDVLAASLSTAHLTAFELTGRLTDLDDAVDLARRAVHDGVPNLHPRRADLAGALRTRYRATRQLKDLVEAVELYR